MFYLTSSTRVLFRRKPRVNVQKRRVPSAWILYSPKKVSRWFSVNFPRHFWRSQLAAPSTASTPSTFAACATGLAFALPVLCASARSTPFCTPFALTRTMPSAISHRLPARRLLRPSLARTPMLPRPHATRPALPTSPWRLLLAAVVPRPTVPAHEDGRLRIAASSTHRRRLRRGRSTRALRAISIAVDLVSALFS